MLAASRSWSSKANASRMASVVLWMPPATTKVNEDIDVMSSVDAFDPGKNHHGF